MIRPGLPNQHLAATLPHERPGLVHRSVKIRLRQPIAWLNRHRERKLMQHRANVGPLDHLEPGHRRQRQERVQRLSANVIRNRTHRVSRS